MRRPAFHRPLWFRVLAVFMWIWLVLIGAISWWSGIATEYCSDRSCRDRAEVGTLVLMGLQIAWALGIAFAMRKPRWHRWALIAGVVLPPATLVTVAAVAYPPSVF